MIRYISASNRKNRLIAERAHDPYKTKKKPPEPAVCAMCNAVFQQGRWRWAKCRPTDARRTICQACRRTLNRYPAGAVTISGAFASRHRAEILRVIRHREKNENREHPEHRIMRIEERPERILIETTDVHLPHAIGESLHDAFKGKIHFRYPKTSYFVEVDWNR